MITQTCFSLFACLILDCAKSEPAAGFNYLSTSVADAIFAPKVERMSYAASRTPRPNKSGGLREDVVDGVDRVAKGG